VPTFDLKNLDAGREYEVALSAVNKKGRSPSKVVSAYTLKMPEKHTDIALSAVTTALMQKREILMMLAGSLIGIILIALLITIVAKLRSSTRNRLDTKSMTNASLPSSIQNDNLDGNNGNQIIHSQDSSPDSSDKNPDIIPHTTTYEEWQQQQQQLQHEANKQIYSGTLLYGRVPTFHSQPQTAAGSYATNPNTNGMIIYSGATLSRSHMNNNFKRIDSNGINTQQVSRSIDLQSQ
jgi:hypothetical protein